jgi:hypothetical protein
MAGDWLKMRNDLDDDPHVMRICELLGGADVDLIIGKLRKLWRHADRHTVDGFIPFASADTIDRIVSLIGFAPAVAAVGWLDLRDDGAAIPRFDEHNGRSAKVRALTAQRVAVHKSKKKPVTHPALPEKRSGNASALPREDKREEKSKGETPLNPPPPLEIDTPDFRRVWEEWLTYRHDRRLSCRPQTLKKQLAFLAALGSASAAVESVEQSIRNGWQGLFESRGPAGNSRAAKRSDLFSGVREFLEGGEHEPS